MSVKLRLKKLASGKKSYYLDIYQNGKRNYEFLKIYIVKGDKSRKEKQQLAESIRAKRELALKSSEYGFIPSFKRNMNFVEYYEDFADSFTRKGDRKYLAACNKFKLFLNKDSIAFKELTPTFCKEFGDFLKSPKTKLKGETPFNYFKCFNRALRKAVDEGMIRKNPAKGIKMPRQGNHLKKNVLSSEELQLLAKTDCKHKDLKRAFLFACYTGLGVAELKELTWDRINNGKIKLNRVKNGEQIINDLHPVAIHILGAAKKYNEKVFKIPKSVNPKLQRWMKKAGIEKSITFYCGRHTFATLLLLNGANLKTVADCLGHTSTQHTIKYLNYIDALKSEAISNLPSIKF